MSSLSQAEKQRLEEALNAAQEEEGSLAAAKRALEARLEEAQRGLARLGQEQQALNRALEEEGKQREALRRGKAELEEQKRLLDKTVCQLNKEVGPGVAWALRKRPSSYRSLPGRERGRVGGQNVCCLLSSSSSAGGGGQGQIFREGCPSCCSSMFLSFPLRPISCSLGPWTMSPGILP